MDNPTGDGFRPPSSASPVLSCRKSAKSMRYNIQGIKPGILVITFYQVDALVNNRHSRKFQQRAIITHTFAVFGSPNPRHAFAKGVSTPKTPLAHVTML